MSLRVIPKMIQKLGIWQGGSPDFLSPASSSVRGHGASGGQERWGKADAAKNHFLNHFRYIDHARPRNLNFGDKLFETQNISKRYHLPDTVIDAVQGVSFFLRKGEILGLIGESGAGKSTLGKMAAGLIPPTEGTLFF